MKYFISFSVDCENEREVNKIMHEIESHNKYFKCESQCFIEDHSKKYKDEKVKNKCH